MKISLQVIINPIQHPLSNNHIWCSFWIGQANTKTTFTNVVKPNKFVQLSQYTCTLKSAKIGITQHCKIIMCCNIE